DGLRAEVEQFLHDVDAYHELRVKYTECRFARQTAGDTGSPAEEMGAIHENIEVRASRLHEALKDASEIDLRDRADLQSRIDRKLEETGGPPADNRALIARVQRRDDLAVAVLISSDGWPGPPSGPEPDGAPPRSPGPKPAGDGNGTGPGRQPPS